VGVAFAPTNAYEDLAKVVGGEVIRRLTTAVVCIFQSLGSLQLDLELQRFAMDANTTIVLNAAIVERSATRCYY